MFYFWSGAQSWKRTFISSVHSCRQQKLVIYEKPSLFTESKRLYYEDWVVRSGLFGGTSIYSYVMVTTFNLINGCLKRNKQENQEARSVWEKGEGQYWNDLQRYIDKIIDWSTFRLTTQKTRLKRPGPKGSVKTSTLSGPLEPFVRLRTQSGNL